MLRCFTFCRIGNVVPTVLVQLGGCGSTGDPIAKKAEAARVLQGHPNPIRRKHLHGPSPGAQRSRRWPRPPGNTPESRHRLGCPAGTVAPHRPPIGQSPAGSAISTSPTPFGVEQHVRNLAQELRTKRYGFQVKLDFALARVGLDSMEHQDSVSVRADRIRR